jgi:hypothetical protein
MLIGIYFCLSLFPFMVDYDNTTITVMFVVCTVALINFANAARLINKHYAKQ